MKIPFAPRFIRLGFAGPYLGMNKNRFNEIVRPYVHEIPIGIQGIAFDRIELDQWADQYAERCARKPRLAVPPIVQGVCARPTDDGGRAAFQAAVDAVLKKGRRTYRSRI